MGYKLRANEYSLEGGAAGSAEQLVEARRERAVARRQLEAAEAASRSNPACQ